MTPAEWMSLIEERAPRLRAAGVTSIRLDGDRMAVSLAPFETRPVTFPADTDTDTDTEATNRVELDPLDDPMTFGGRLPNLHPSTPDEPTDG